MTISELRAELQSIGFSLRVRDGEYRVNFKGGAEATAYYTDDRLDALSTAYLMASVIKSVHDKNPEY